MKASDTMKGFFNMDNPLFRFLGRLADLMILNLSFIICSIPIFTIGAALTGMSYVLLKVADKEEGYIFKAYLKSFKQNFKQATIIWLIALFIGIILGVDFLILKDATGTLAIVMKVMIMAAALFYLMMLIYVFPVLARFENSVTATIKNALILSIAYFPRTVVMLVILVGAIVLSLWNYYTIIWGLLIWILFGFALICYAHCFFLSKIFAKISPATETDNEDPDNWVLDEPAAEEQETPDSITEK